MDRETSPELPENKGRSRVERIFFAVFFGLIFAVVGITYHRYLILKDYYIQVEAECDPAREKCFIYECDPSEEGGECPEDPEEGISYYKLIKKKAFAIPDCDPASLDCPKLFCAPEEDCEETLCEEESLEEGEKCSDPETYLEEQAKGDSGLTSEEEEACAEEDESCKNEDPGQAQDEGGGDQEDDSGEPEKSEPDSENKES